MKSHCFSKDRESYESIIVIVFISSLILSHVITESSILFATYLSFSQVHVTWFQI